jgi:hypothetical protein
VRVWGVGRGGLCVSSLRMDNCKGGGGHSQRNKLSVLKTNDAVRVALGLELQVGEPEAVLIWVLGLVCVLEGGGERDTDAERVVVWEVREVRESVGE